MIKRQHTEYLWMTYPAVSLSQSSASAACWPCMTEDINNIFFLLQKSSKYLCKIWILGIFGRNICFKGGQFLPNYTPPFSIILWCEQFLCHVLIQVDISPLNSLCIPLVQIPHPTQARLKFPPPARDYRQIAVGCLGAGMLKLQVNQPISNKPTQCE